MPKIAINRSTGIPVVIALMLIGCVLGWSAWHSNRSGNPPVAPAESPQDFSFSGNTMGGTWSVKINQLPSEISRDAAESSVADLLAHLDGQLSIWKPESGLSRFNQFRGMDWFPVPEELASVTAQALIVSGQSNGAFDPTVGLLVLLWGFGPQKTGGQIGKIPTDDAIAAAQAHVGYRLLEVRLDPPAMRKSDPQVYVDLGGIAKGYAADLVAKNLQSRGIQNYLVAVGGELRAHGVSSNSHPWRVGVETPTPDVRRVFATLDLKDASLSTSGDYRNFFEVAGVRYCHEIDPGTGRPIPAGLASVSVVHSSGTTADAMATALMVLGPQEGYLLACRLKLAALFIERKSDHFETKKTPEFEKIGGLLLLDGQSK